MSIRFEWDPDKQVGILKIIHTTGATYSSFLDHHDTEESSFRILLSVLDEETRRKVSPEAYEMAFSKHPLGQGSRPPALGGVGNRNPLVGLLGMGRRRRKHRRSGPR